ncbi:hypothetical protein QUF82_13395 [Thiotrichales bacterium HSG14]|nr:hypothetical protein [Thiotrichales bacterium HSG14]
MNLITLLNDIRICQLCIAFLPFSPKPIARLLSIRVNSINIKP